MRSKHKGFFFFLTQIYGSEILTTALARVKMELFVLDHTNVVVTPNVVRQSVKKMMAGHFPDSATGKTNDRLTDCCCFFFTLDGRWRFITTFI